MPGNDDCGTLSAWIVYSMMGIYPVCPGDTNYAITTPVFDKITIELNPEFYKGKSFEILTHRKNKDDLFIDKMMISGKKQNSYFITHKTISKGGKLEFFLKK